MSLNPIAIAQTPSDVTTWHNDIGRTGWQQHETVLSPSTVTQGTFGKVFQYNVQGAVFAQPLALGSVTGINACNGACDIVLVVTEQDMLYAFRADSATQLWSRDLAGAVHGTYLNCSDNLLPPCATGVIYPAVGVTGTPVIDVSAGVLYVVSMVYFPVDGSEQYYLHVVDYRSGAVLASIEVASTYAGQPPSGSPPQCNTAPTSGTISFDASSHYQRAALLLFNVDGTNEVFVAFAPAGGELANGWFLAYRYAVGPPAALSLATVFVTTPYGTGGGIWMSSAGPAADAGNIYLTTGNGTFDASGVQNPSSDYGDSMLKLNPLSLAVADYFTPADVFTFEGTGRCRNDDDFGSGGVMIFPDSFFAGYENLMVTGDKESTLYVVDRDHLTSLNSPHNAVVQEVTTPATLWKPTRATGAARHIGNGSTAAQPTAPSTTRLTLRQKTTKARTLRVR